MSPITSTIPRRASRRPRVLAVADCGTTSVRAAVVEYQGRGHRILEQPEAPLDCTRTLQGRDLDRSVMDRLSTVLAELERAAVSYGGRVERVVGTSALRGAANVDVVLEEVERRSGVTIELVDAAEEARLYVGALRQLWRREGVPTPRGSVLMMDVGAGTTVVSVIKRGKLVHALDEHFGTLRVYEHFRDLRDQGDLVASIERFTLGAARMMLRRLPEQRFAHLVVTGSEMRHLGRMLGGEGEIGTLGRQGLEAWYRDIRELEPQARAAACGCDPRTAAHLLLAVNLLRHLLAETGAGEVRVPQLRLLDGLVCDLLPGSLGPHHLDRSQLVAAARNLAQRYDADLEYCANTAALAGQLFDQTACLHGLGERERSLLEFAAWVHDIGAFINVRNRHKHTAYLVRAGSYPGLTDEEVEVVALVARYHRRATPKSSHDDFMALSRPTRVLVQRLAALLRLAYGLDVERTQRIHSVSCTVSGTRLLITVDRRQVALERWAVQSKAKLFTSVFGLEVVLLPRD